MVELEEIEEDTPRLLTGPQLICKIILLTRMRIPSVFDESIFEHYLISSTGILFHIPPDHESDMGGKIAVNAVVRDEQNLKWEDTFEVEFTPIDEPPLYNLGNYGTIIPGSP